jgi:hypothetical protein
MHYYYYFYYKSGYCHRYNKTELHANYAAFFILSQAF